MLGGRPRVRWCVVAVLLGACSSEGGGDGPSRAGSAGEAGSLGGSGSGGSSSSGGSSGAPGSGGTAEAAAGGSAAVGGSSSGGSSSGGSSSGAAGGSAGATATLADVLPRELFESLFPNRNALYAYDALIEAAAKYPELGTTGTLDERRRELAAFLGNISHETTGGWAAAPGGPQAWGLYFTQEVGCESGACTNYCDPSNVEYPCAPGKTYHGRGPIQLSWNFNYGAFGAALGLDLLSDPDLVTSDGEIAFETALWFWMTPQAPKPSAHAVMLGLWQPTPADASAGRAPGFGMTVNIINGGLECGIPTDARVRDRIAFYRRYVEAFGTSEGDNLECSTMTPY
jgi:basic endochitinase B